MPIGSQMPSKRRLAWRLRGKLSGIAPKLLGSGFGPTDPVIYPKKMAFDLVLSE